MVFKVARVKVDHKALRVRQAFKEPRVLKDLLELLVPLEVLVTQEIQGLLDSLDLLVLLEIQEVRVEQESRGFQELQVLLDRQETLEIPDLLVHRDSMVQLG